MGTNNADSTGGGDCCSDSGFSVNWGHAQGLAHVISAQGTVLVVAPVPVLLGLGEGVCLEPVPTASLHGRDANRKTEHRSVHL